MSFKIPCGGFRLDEKSFSLDENGVLSIPKPLTYDYMPEGYPSKSIEYVTLMEEQEVTFTEHGGLMGTNSPVDLEIKLGDKLTVVWDGASYDVEVTKVAYGPRDMLVFGNVGLVLPEDKSDYPFMYSESAEARASQWITTDTATSHTIKVMRQQETITPMSADFIPPMKNLNVVFSRGSGSSIPTSCNVTYDELRGWVENGTPVFAIYKIEGDDGSVSSVRNIVNFEIFTYSLRACYLSRSIEEYLEYNSDGTFSGSGPS